MCGICGIIHEDPSRSIDRKILERMNRTMIYRGPDDEGYYVGRGAALAMRRLSIIDVVGGHQPLSSEDGDIAAVCNGELYNFREIKSDLEGDGHVFRTRSDTEILPHLYQRDGVGFVQRINGMFGLAVWDEPNRTLVIARDRMGKKPLYWTMQDGAFIFASELKAILANPDVQARLSRRSLSKYLAHEYIPAPHSIFENIYKLEPGHLIHLRDGKPTVRKYWDLPMGDELLKISEGEAVERLLDLLQRSVKRRLVSDVPLGVFLSGGIDSSAVVAMMARLMDPSDIKTFSISFAEKSFDESSHARRVADHFHTDHREQTVGPDDLIALLPEIAALLDEPMADNSIVPTYALSRFTRQHVTVALGGDGGDELFAGYPTFQAEVYAGIYDKIPAFLKDAVIGPIADRLPISDDNISFDFKVRQFLKGASVQDISRHMYWMGAFSPEEQKRLLAFDIEGDIFEDIHRYERAATMCSKGNRILYAYKKLYLAEDILTKVDRASMWTSLEARAPLLDHELVEFVFRLPYGLKLKRLRMKHIFKRAMKGILPPEIIERSKKGFGTPVAKWIKGPLRDMFCDLLAPDRINRDGLFRAGEVWRLLDDHLKCRADNRMKLWTLVVFQNWMEKWGQ